MSDQIEMFSESETRDKFERVKNWLDGNPEWIHFMGEAHADGQTLPDACEDLANQLAENTAKEKEEMEKNWSFEAELQSELMDFASHLRKTGQDWR